MAIGPSTDAVSAQGTSEAGTVLVITLLLTSGARHPYKIDEKYLTKRNVNVPGVTESGRERSVQYQCVYIEGVDTEGVEGGVGATAQQPEQHTVDLFWTVIGR